jgi:hypothetical protein
LVDDSFRSYLSWAAVASKIVESRPCAGSSVPMSQTMGFLGIRPKQPIEEAAT